MKNKIFIGIGIVIFLVAVFISTTWGNKNAPDKITESIPKHVEKVNNSNLFKNEKKIEQPKDTWNHQPINPTITLEELAGHINKEYGIREDILRYIEKSTSSNNKTAMKAAIAYAQLSHFIYYKATENEAMKASHRELLALHCLGKSLPNRKSYILIDGINKLMRNTPERDKHMWEIDEKYFGWKVLGFGDLSTKQLNEICKNESY